MRVKTNGTFRLTKRTKTIMATIVDPIMRNQFKNMMIDAQVASSIVMKSSKEKDSK